MIISSALLFVILTLWFAWVRDVSDTWKSRTDMFGHPLRLLGAVITSVTLYFGYKHFLESGISIMDIARSESLIHFSAFLSFGLGTLRSSPQGNINNVA